MEGARLFTQDEKRCALERQEYMCGGCGQDLWEEHIGFGQGHHILPYSMGGGTTMDQYLYEQSHFLALRNKKNQQIKKTIWRYQ